MRRPGNEYEGAHQPALTLSVTSPRERRWLIYGVITAVALLGLGMFVAEDDDDPPSSNSFAAIASVRLAGIDGSYVLVGENPGSERLYRVDGGRLHRVAGRASFAGATTVTASGSTVIVAIDKAESSSTIRQVRDGRLQSVGIASGYAPSLSAGGALAWASADTPRTDQVTVFARDSIASRQRVVATFDNVVAGDPLVVGVDWAGADLVIGVVRDGVATAFSFENGRGPAKTVGRMEIASDFEGGVQTADFVAGGRTIVFTSQVNNLRKSLDEEASGSLPMDHFATCVTDTDYVLTNLNGTLRLERDERDGRLVGRIPPSLSLFDVACPH